MTTQAHVVLRHIRELTAAENPDRQLLERFTTERDEEAFTALVRRHGPLVQGVCRRVLDSRQDAEDAFQATFLVLARKAVAIHQRDSVSGWLHRVAYHVALQTRARASERRRRERHHQPKRPIDPFTDVSGRELVRILDEELQGLSEEYRMPLVLCYLEGKTRDEAAQLLGWSLGTLKRRLEQGKKCLQARLTRRGLTLAVVLLAAEVSRKTAVAVSPLLVRSAVAAAVQITAGKTASGVLGALLGTKLQIVSAFLMVVVALGVGVLTWTSQTQEQAERSAQVPTPGKAPVQEQAGIKPLFPPQPEPFDPKNKNKMTVTGRVLDGGGKPVAEARVAVAARAYGRNLASRYYDNPEVLGQTQTDKQGQFRLEVECTSSDRHYLVKVLASAAGHGLGEQVLDADAGHHEVTLRLPREQVVRGRLLDIQGEPAAGVQVRVVRIEIPKKDHVLSFFEEPEKAGPWPKPVKSDAQGRLVLRGLAPGVRVTLRVDDDRFALQARQVDTGDKKDPEAFTWSLAPPQTLVGKVVYDDTDKPVPGARLKVESLVKREGLDGVWDVRGPAEGRADEKGQFRLNPFTGSTLVVTAFAPAGEPYLSLTRDVAWPKGAVKHQVEIRLPAGILVHGKVTEVLSGKPVAGATVRFQRRISLNLRDQFSEGFQGAVVSGSDGSFRIAVTPGPGHLLVIGPTPDYLHVETTARKLSEDKPGGQRYYPDGLLALDLKLGTKSHEVKISLRRGVTLKGRLVGPDDKAVNRALMYCPLQTHGRYTYPGRPVLVRDGCFTLPGFDPKGKVRVVFLAEKEGLGAVVELSGKQAGGEPVTVRLERCGTAVARFLDKTGKPRVNYRPAPALVLTPGIPLTGEDFPLDKGVGADVAYPQPSRQEATDAEGRITFRALIPGATYRITDWDGRLVIRREFTVEPGKNLDLKDITLKNPW
jgi:RNA polymerase sigma factor (sigma-70 family)